MDQRSAAPVGGTLMMRHFLIAAAILIALVSLCQSFGVFDHSVHEMHGTEFYGHLYLASSFLFMGVFEMTTLPASETPFAMETINSIEYKGCFALALGYIIFDIFCINASSPLAPNFAVTSYTPTEQQHFAVMLLVMMCGALGLLLPARAFNNQPNHFAIIMFCLGFGYFIYQHEQPNQVGVTMHAATAGFVLFHAILRFLGYRQEAGATIFIAGHLLLYGQYWVIIFIDEQHMHPTTFLLFNVAFSIFWVCVYVVAFPLGHAGDVSFMPVKTISDEEEDALMIAA